MTDKKNFPGSNIPPVERRRFIRIIEMCPLMFITPKGANGEGELVDLSLRGIRFTSGEILLVGERVRTVFILSNGISLDLTGLVRHKKGGARKWIYGLEFSIRDHRDLKEHIKLNNYILRVHAEQDNLLREKLSRNK